MVRVHGEDKNELTHT